MPAYAPELNPDEGIWKLLKRTELRNLCCDDLTEPRLELRLAAARLRHKTSVIRGVHHPVRLRSVAAYRHIT